MKEVNSLLEKMSRARKLAKVLSTVCIILALLLIYQTVQRMALEKQLEYCQQETKD